MSFDLVKYTEFLDLTQGEGGGGGASAYGDLTGKPKINGVTINGNHDGAYYGLQDKLTAGRDIEIVSGGTQYNYKVPEIEGIQMPLAVDDNGIATCQLLEDLGECFGGIKPLQIADKMVFKFKITANNEDSNFRSQLHKDGVGYYLLINPVGSSYLDIDTADDSQRYDISYTINTDCYFVIEKTSALNYNLYVTTDLSNLGTAYPVELPSDDINDYDDYDDGINGVDLNAITAEQSPLLDLKNSYYETNGVKTYFVQESDEVVINYTGTGGAVDSVNGKTGDVVLKAEDIQVKNTQSVQANLERIDSEVEDIIDNKQDKLVSGTNIKTINGNSVLGSGNLVIQGGGTNVEANPILAGNESFLRGLKVGDTKYSTKTDLSGKVISIMGDSISTYEGWIPNSAGINDGTGTLMHAVFYPTHGSYVNNVNMTWWYKLIFNKFKAKLGVNESWSGSFVGNNKDTNTATTTTCHSPGNDTGPDTCMASNTRIKRLEANGTPDIIYVYGGTNDIAQPGTPGESLGTFNSSTDYSTIDLSSTKWTTFVDAYRTMIQRMQYYYPKAKIIVLLPTYSVNYYNRANLDAWVEQIKNICDYFGVNYIDLRACGISWANSSSSRNAKGIQTLGDQNIHPNELGHTLIADYVEAETYKILNQDFKENVVYTVTNDLSTVVNTKSYITGVSYNESYSATITGTDLTVVKVYMNNTDITSSAYNSGTGAISISHVTGNVTINEGEPIIVDVTGVQLNANTKSISPNDEEILTATVLPLNATNKNVTWSVNNSNVSIEPNGLTCTCTGVTNGTSIVTVTTEDGSYTASCTFTVHQIALTGIEVTTPPSKIAYHYGETFNPDGVVITASYDDGTSEVLDSSDYTYSPTTALTDDTDITFSFTYNGVTKTATQAVTVATLDSIEITAQPTKTSYFAGETFDPTGMIVTANWSDDTTSTISDYTYTPTSALETTDTEITISYTVGGVTKTTTQSITVSERIKQLWDNSTERSGVTIPDTSLDKSNWSYGYIGSSVKAKYYNKDINFLRMYPDEVGTISVYVFTDDNIYGRSDSATLIVDTATATITSDMLNKWSDVPLDKTLHIGSNEFWAVVTGTDTGSFKYQNTMPLTALEYGMYNYLGQTRPVTTYTGGYLAVDAGYDSSLDPQPKELTSIAITTQPTKTEYIAGETFDPSGMVVTATYDDDTTAVVTGYAYSPNTALTTSDTTITISYTKNNITKTATQSITVSELEIQYHTNNIDLPLNAEAKPDYASFVNYSDTTFFEGKIIKSVRFKPYKAGTLTVGLVQVANWTSSSSIANRVTITVNPDDVDVVTEYPLNLTCGTGYAPYVMLTTDTATFWYSETGGNGFKNQIARNRNVGESAPCNLGVDFGYISE